VAIVVKWLVFQLDPLADQIVIVIITIIVTRQAKCVLQDHHQLHVPLIHSALDHNVIAMPDIAQKALP